MTSVHFTPTNTDSPDNPDAQAAFSLGLQSLSGLESLVERPLFADSFVYEGQPVMLTEAGGISLKTGKDKKAGAILIQTAKKVFSQLTAM